MTCDEDNSASLSETIGSVTPETRLDAVRGPQRPVRWVSPADDGHSMIFTDAWVPRFDLVLH